jgi:hypothetical protein
MSRNSLERILSQVDEGAALKSLDQIKSGKVPSGDLPNLPNLPSETQPLQPQ